MDYEDKYKKALEEARVWYGQLRETGRNDYANELEHIFGELKECEGERMRKAIICLVQEFYKQTSAFYNGESVKDMLAWLEKQGQKETTWNKEDEENMNNVLYILNQLKNTSYKEDDIAEKTINWVKSLKERLCSNNEYDKDMLGAIEYCTKNNRTLEKEHIAWLEKQAEQNPTDEFKTRFHEGDWVVDNEYDTVYQVGKFLNSDFKLIDLIGYEYWESYYNATKYHLWTINDARKGDVLQLGNVTAIFKDYLGNMNCKCYCSFCKGEFDVPTKDESYGTFNSRPATKEQCDCLFQNMKEAGYEWNKDTLELKQI
jgi:hypothetical protein